MITGSSLLKTLTCSELFLLSTPLLFQRMTRDVCASAKYWKHRNSHLFLSMFFPLSNQFLVLMLREEFAISPQQGHLDKALALSCLYSSLCIIMKLQQHFFFWPPGYILPSRFQNWKRHCREECLSLFYYVLLHLWESYNNLFYFYYNKP